MWTRTWYCVTENGPHLLTYILVLVTAIGLKIYDLPAPVHQLVISRRLHFPLAGTNSCYFQPLQSPTVIWYRMMDMCHILFRIYSWIESLLRFIASRSLREEHTQRLINIGNVIHLLDEPYISDISCLKIRYCYRRRSTILLSLLFVLKIYSYNC